VSRCGGIFCRIGVFGIEACGFGSLIFEKQMYW
jgi:hypothetical protein